MTQKTKKGRVDAIADYRSNDYFNIALDDAENDDNWYIGDGTLDKDISKGDKVELLIENGSIIDVMEAGESESSGGETSSDKSAQQSGDKPASNNSYTDKNHSIQAQKALDLAERKHHDDEFSSEGEAMDQILTTAEGFFNWLKEKSQKGDER